MPRILHTADLHIGKNRRFPDYLSRSKALINEIHEVCSTYKVDFLVIAGDTLDTKFPTQEERELVAYLLGECPVPVILTSGNHEYIGPSWKNTALRWLSNITPKLKGVKFLDEPDSIHWRGAWWLVIPYSNFNTLSFNLVTKHLLSKIPKNTHDPIIAIAHEFFNGAIIRGPHKNRTELPHLKRIDYWALGDIHKCQQLQKNAWYCGSPLQQDFGEKPPKGILIVDVNKNRRKVSFVDLKRPKKLKIINGIPKNWPHDNAYIKLVCKAKDLPNPLPSNVVALSTLTKKELQQQGEEVHALVGTKPLVKEVKSYLRKKGFNPIRVKRAMKFCKKALNNIE